MSIARCWAKELVTNLLYFIELILISKLFHKLKEQYNFLISNAKDSDVICKSILTSETCPDKEASTTFLCSCKASQSQA